MGGTISPGADDQSRFKQQAAEHAVRFVRSGMVVGLGTGTTAIFATRRIAELLQNGELSDIRGFATSKQVWEESQRLHIPMMDEAMPQSIDLTIDGADEVDSDLNLIKGGGGALLREKVVAQASSRVFIAIDEGKVASQLGTLHALPVEVLAFGWRSQVRFLESLGACADFRLRDDRSRFLTDSGNFILDCRFGPIGNPSGLAAKLAARAGIIEHGLFIGLATDVIVAGEGGVRHIRRQDMITDSTKSYRA